MRVVPFGELNRSVPPFLAKFLGNSGSPTPEQQPLLSTESLNPRLVEKQRLF